MGEQPKLTRQEPWELISAFGDNLNKDARLNDQAAETILGRRERFELLQKAIAEKAALRNASAGASSSDTIAQPGLSPKSTAVEKQVLEELKTNPVKTGATKVAAKSVVPGNDPYEDPEAAKLEAEALPPRAVYGPAASGNMVGSAPILDSTQFSKENGDTATKWLLTVDKAPPALKSVLVSTAEKYGLDPNVLAAQSYQESRWNPSARSPAGAEGFSQFMPATAREYGVNSRSVLSSIDGQARYMAKALDANGGNLGLALAAYNAGQGNVNRFLKTGKLPTETLNYVKAITGRSIQDWMNGPTQVASNSTAPDEPLYWLDA